MGPGGTWGQRKWWLSQKEKKRKFDWTRSIRAWKPLAEHATLSREPMDTGRESSVMQTTQRHPPFLALPLLGKWVRQSVAPRPLGVCGRPLSGIVEVAPGIIIKPEFLPWSLAFSSWPRRLTCSVGQPNPKTPSAVHSGNAVTLASLEVGAPDGPNYPRPASASPGKLSWENSANSLLSEGGDNL